MQPAWERFWAAARAPDPTTPEAPSKAAAPAPAPAPEAAVPEYPAHPSAVISRAEAEELNSDAPDDLDEEQLLERLVDQLSDTYGFCINGITA
eukprot:SAG11_NODE_4297_length_1965_cov_2.383173_3_plen_93_part_00